MKLVKATALQDFVFGISLGEGKSYCPYLVFRRFWQCESGVVEK